MRFAFISIIDLDPHLHEKFHPIHYAGITNYACEVTEKMSILQTSSTN